MFKLNLKDKAIIEALVRQGGHGSVVLKALSKNENMGSYIRKYIQRPLIASDYIGGKVLHKYLSKIKGKGRIANASRKLSKRVMSEDMPLSIGGKMVVVPRVPLVSAPLGHSADIVRPGAALLGGFMLSQAIKNRRRSVKPEEQASNSEGEFYYE